MNESTVTQLLEKLGLTEYEAKSLNALFKLSESEAPEISRLSQVPKTRVYDVLDKLVAKGLAIEIKGRPKKYRVVETDKAFEILLEEKKKEVKELEKKTADLKKLIPAISAGGTEKERILKVKERNDFIKILNQELGNAKKSVIGFTETEAPNALKKTLKGIAEKSLEVKLISAIKDKQLIEEYAEKGIKLRDHDHGLHAYIIDDSKVVMGLSDFKQNKPEYHFAIWQENPAMINALKTYFQSVWDKTKSPEE